MEIFNENRGREFQLLKKKFSYKRFLVRLVIIFTILGFGIGCIAYGAYLNKTGQTPLLKMLALRVKAFDFSFIPKYGKSQLSESDMLSLDVSFKNWKKIEYYREKGLQKGNLNNLIPEEVNAEIRYKDQTYKAKISITGQTTQHIIHPKKWSLLVKLKNGKTIKGVNKFALLYPRARGYLTDWTAFKLLSSQGLIGLKTDFVDVEVNGKNHGLFYFEERFGKNLLSHNDRVNGLIFKRDLDLKVYELNKEVAKSEELSHDLIRLKKILHGFFTNEIDAEKVFDIEKFATLFVVSDLMNQKHALFRGNSRMYFNPVTNLIEPIGREWGYLRRETYTPMALSIEKPDPTVNYHENLHKDSVFTKFLNSPIFLEAYLKKAAVLSEKKYLDSVLEIHQDEYNYLMKKIHSHNPFYLYPIDLLYKNQETMRNKIYPATPGINAFIGELTDNEIILDFQNRIDLPIEIHHVKYGNRILDQNKQILLKPKYKAYGVKEAFAFKFNNPTDDKLFSTDSLYVYYSILGINKYYETPVFKKTMSSKDFNSLVPTKKTGNLDSFEFLKIENKQIYLTQPTCQIEKDMVIPKGYVFNISPGTKLDLINASKIISYSPLSFMGGIDNPITIYSSDSTGQGIVVLNTKKESHLSHVQFNHLSTIVSDQWKLKGPITFYESPVNFDNCVFEGNLSGESMLHLIRSEFSISNSSFTETFASALRVDFGNGTIDNTNFKGINKKGISAIGSTIDVNRIKIEGAGVVGIAVDQNAKITTTNSLIANRSIGVLARNNAVFVIENSTIDSCQVGFGGYVSNKAYSAGRLVLKGNRIENTATNYVFQKGFTLVNNGERLDVATKKAKDKLEVNEESN